MPRAAPPNDPRRRTRGTALSGRRLERPWGGLQVWTGGRGPTTILPVHGLGGSGRYWTRLAALVGDRYRVVAPDLAGFGRSDKPDAVSYDRAFHLDNLDAVMADIPGRIVVVGHSAGGILAALWAARNPHRVAALAMVAAPYPQSGRGMPARDQRLSEHDQRDVRRRLYRTFQVAWPVVTFPVLSRVFPRAVIRDYMLHTLTSYWATAQALVWDPATEGELSALAQLRTAPALILSAGDDRRVPSGDAQRWARLLPQAEMSVTTGGHQLLLRGGFARLAAWIAQLNTTPPGRGEG